MSKFQIGQVGRYENMDKLKRLEYLNWIATERRELDDSEELELRELESEFCIPFGGCHE